MRNKKYQILYKLSNKDYIFDLISNQIKEINKDSSSLFSKFLNEHSKEDEITNFLFHYSKISNSQDLDLTIITTTSCNFNCKYCYQNLENYTIDNDFEKNICLYIEKNITKYKRVYIEWFGGEPLLCFERIISISKKIISICQDYGVPYLASITTNGYYLNAPIFEELLEHKVIKFQVTIDGDMDTHNKFRPLKNGKPTYNEIMENLMEIRDKFGNKKYFDIIIRNNISEESLLGIDSFLNDYNEKFGQCKNFTLLPYPIGDWGGSMVKSIKGLFTYDQFIDKMNKKYKKHKIHIDIGIRPENMICYAAKRFGYTIDPLGNIYKCSHYILSETKKASKNNYIGNILDLNESKKSNLVNRKFIKPNIVKECFDCDYLPYCLYRHCPLAVLKNYKNCKKLVRQEIDKGVYAEIMR